MVVSALPSVILGPPRHCSPMSLPPHIPHAPDSARGAALGCGLLLVMRLLAAAAKPRPCDDLPQRPLHDRDSDGVAQGSVPRPVGTSAGVPVRGVGSTAVLPAKAGVTISPVGALAAGEALKALCLRWA